MFTTAVYVTVLILFTDLRAHNVGNKNIGDGETLWLKSRSMNMMSICNEGI